MLIQFLKELEKRPPIETLCSGFPQLFEKDSAGHLKFSDEAFSSLSAFLQTGEASFQNIAVQAGVRWSTSSQKVMLRNTILRRGFITPSCLWAYKQMRGNLEELYKHYPSPEMTFMQIVLFKETDAAQSVPYLIEKFLMGCELSEELRASSRLCVLRLLDSGAPPELLRTLRRRYPGVEILNQWRPGILRRTQDLGQTPNRGPVDFHQMVRSVHDLKELSSLARTIYLTSLFYVPLTEKEWRSLWLSHTDQVFFQRLRQAGMVEAGNGGFLLTTEPSKQAVARKFLYDSYSLAKESVHRNRAVRVREERERRVKSSQLDRQALEMVPDGIICVDRTGLLYYMNPAAEAILNENKPLREKLFGAVSLEEALRKYSREEVLSRITASLREDAETAQIFGDRVAIEIGGKRFEVELGRQVILLRDTSDQHLINQEIGRLYRHELKAALDVMGVGINTAKELAGENRVEDAMEFLDQVERKRVQLFDMLEERMDFIRLHSDAFQIRPSAVNLNLVVDKCVGNYREAAGSKGILINSNHLDSPGAMVRGEERFLIRALDNIIRNAIKFSGKDAKIAITLGTDNLDALVRVEDSGPGIPPENLGKIFQLGFTTAGSGRGLYLARRIAMAHNGKIEVKSKPGHGACFILRLPLLVEH